MATVRLNWDTTTNLDALRGGIRNVFDSTGGVALVESGEMYNMISTSDYINRDLRRAGLDYGGEVGEGVQIPIQDPKFGQKLDYTQAKFGTGFRITYEMKKYNKIDEMKALTASLKKVQLEMKDVELAKLWNSPTGTYRGFENKPLGSATQLTLDQASTGYDNIGGEALGTTALQNALYYFDTAIDDQGNTAPKIPTMLAFHPTLQWTAYELFKSANMPHEQSNTINSYKAWDMKLFNYHRLTTATRWFMLAKQDEAFDVNCFTASSPDFVFEGPFDTTRDTLVTSIQDFQFGFGDPRCVYVGYS